MDWNDLSHFKNAVGVFQIQAAQRRFTLMNFYPRTLLVVTSLFLLVGCPNTADSHKTVKRSGLRSTLFSIPEITTVANVTKTLNFTSQDEPINS